MKKSENKFILLAAATLLAALLAGCGGKEKPEGVTAESTGVEQDGGASRTQTETAEGGGSGEPAGDTTDVHRQSGTGIAGESAKDTQVDFEALKKENPDIFAWLYIPGTDIDCPVLQSTQADDFYESHDAFGKENEEGALYTELANLTNMCDFNTVIHGKAPRNGEKGLFTDLYKFGDPDFFADHKDIYLYLEGNLLTYTVFAAYERENDSLIRSYDFTYGGGCEKFLADLYGTREMGKNLREGWEGITPYNFLITLTAGGGADAEKQFVVVAALTGDAAGKIDRAVEW